MAVSKLPNGRFRAQTYDSTTGKFVSSAKVLGLKEGSFPTESKAHRADAAAAKLLADRRPNVLTVAAWAKQWTSDSLFQRPKESTNIHNRERIKRFVETYGSLPLGAVDDAIVARWVAGGKNKSTVPTLKAMFNDAASAEAGRLISSNPFMGLRLSKGKGRAKEQPPSEDEVREMVGHAKELTCPGFAAWLEVAAWSGMRPGELDALKWSSVDFAVGRIKVLEQWNVKIRDF